MPPDLTVRELVDRFAAYYPHPRGVDETIELVGLSEQSRVRAAKLSGGMQRRLDVALAVVGDPDLIFLDEPTTGFDPTARRQAWGMIGDLRNLGKTVVLSTHFMDEAEALADHLVLVARGKPIAEGTPGTLRAMDPMSQIMFSQPDLDCGELPAGIRQQVTASNGHLVIQTADPVATLATLTSWAVSRGAKLPGLEVRHPSLEDVYLKLVKEAEA